HCAARTVYSIALFFFFSSRRRHTRFSRDWSSDVCSSDLPVTAALPIDFEGAIPPFEGFGGSTYEVVDNPAADAVNGSAKVGKYVKGLEGSWAGITTLLSAPLDFSVNTVLRYHVHSPVTGKALFKIENSADANQFVEVFADVTQTNQ